MVGRAGFTVVEVAVAVCIFAIVFLAAFAAWGISWDSYATAEACTSTNEEVRKALDCLVEDVSEGGALTVVDLPNDDVWRSSITFRTPAGVQAGGIVWSPDTVQYTLGGTGGTQLLRISGNDRRVVANGILAFGARRPATSQAMVEFSVTAQRQSAPLPVDARLAFKVKMRN